MSQWVTQNEEHDNCDENFGYFDLPDLVYVQSRKKSVSLFDWDADLEVHVDQGQQRNDRVKCEAGHVPGEDIHPGGSQGGRRSLDFVSSLLGFDFEKSRSVDQEGKQENKQNSQQARSISSMKIWSAKERGDIRHQNWLDLAFNNVKPKDRYFVLD